MEKISTEYLLRCIETLEQSLVHLKKSEKGSIEYEMFRNSLVKGFEITLEQSGKLLKKMLTPYFSSKKAVDQLTFKDVFRFAHKHGILNDVAVDRWFAYGDNRNSTAHDYGVAFAEETLKLAESLIEDAKELEGLMNHD